METIIEKLKKYFQNNSREKIEKDWKKTEMYDKIGPSIEEFIFHSKILYEIELKNSYWEFYNINKLLKNPEFTSDFLFI